MSRKTPEDHVSEALAYLYDAPERLVDAFTTESGAELVSVIACINSAIGELRQVYDDRADRFLDDVNGLGSEYTSTKATLQEIAEKCDRFSVKDAVKDAEEGMVTS